MMESIRHFFNNNLDVVFFIYGAAFWILGIAIAFQPKKTSEFQIARIFWLLAVFGIMHGINEFLDMWALIKGRHHLFDMIRWVVLVSSFMFLFEFGRQLFHLSRIKAPSWQKRLAKPFVWWLLPLIGIMIFIFGYKSSDFWRTSSILTRYFIAFPAGILISFGFFSYYECEKKTLKPLKMKKPFFVCGLAFLSYSIFSGLVVPKGSFFPSSWLNVESFFLAIGVPVQAFRVVFAVVAAYSTFSILKIFSWEMMGRLQDSQKRLEQQLIESEEIHRNILDNSDDIIFSVNINGFITSSNRRGYQILGVLKDELIGKHIKKLFTPETQTEIDKALVRLTNEGSFFLDKGQLVGKKGEIIDAEILLWAIFNIKGTYVGGRALIRDVREKMRITSELKKRIRELEEFYDMVVGREVKMVELKEEIKSLEERLRRYTA